MEVSFWEAELILGYQSWKQSRCRRDIPTGRVGNKKYALDRRSSPRPFAGVPNRELPTTNTRNSSTLVVPSPSCQRPRLHPTTTLTNHLASAAELHLSLSPTPTQPLIIVIWSHSSSRRLRWATQLNPRPHLTSQRGARGPVRTAGKERTDVKER